MYAHVPMQSSTHAHICAHTHIHTHTSVHVAHTASPKWHIIEKMIYTIKNTPVGERTLKNYRVSYTLKIWNRGVENLIC
jgi:hypothetical protein